MIRYFVCMLVPILLAVSACTPSAHPTPESASVAAPTAPSANAPGHTQLSSMTAGNVTPSPAATPTVATTLAPNPLNVKVKMDNTISASAVVSSTGGTITVQGAEGTKFTLTFPKGALHEDTKITLTPLTSVDGLPFSGGLVGGVQMAPEGLRLLQPATLTIESPKTVAAKGFETIAFAYHQSGEGMYLSRSDTQGNALTLEVWHFSGAGAAQGTAAEIQTQQQQHVPSDAEDALTQRVGEYVRLQHEAVEHKQKPDPEWRERMSEFAREYYDRFIAPQLPIILQDCKAGTEIVSKAASWAHNVAILGLYEDETFRAEIDLIFDTAYEGTLKCYNKEYEQCLIDNDIKHRIAMLEHLRNAQLMGFDNRLDQSKIDKCPTHYRVDGIYAGYDQIPVKGVICALNKPFTLEADGQNPSGGKYTGAIAFAPAGASGGGWKHSATTCALGSKCATINSSGTYQVKGDADGKLVITMNSTMEAMAIEGKGKSFQVPVWQFELIPDTGDCSAE